MKKPDYLPGTDEDFDSMQTNFMLVLLLNYVAWTIPAAAVNILQALQTTWVNAFAVGGIGKKTTRTSQQTKAKTTAGKSYKKGLRGFVQMWISHNPLVQDSDKQALRVTIKDTTRTKPAIPNSKPVCNRNSSPQHLQAVIDVRDELTTSSRKKQGDSVGYQLFGMLISPAQNTPVPVPMPVPSPAQPDPSAFVFMGLFTKHNATITFTNANEGKKFYFRMRWINSHSEAGPWSDVFSVIIT